MKLLKQSTTRLSCAVKLVDASAPQIWITNKVHLEIRDTAVTPLFHREGFWLFLDLGPGPHVFTWQAEHYENGEQIVDLAALPRLVPLVEIPLVKPPPVMITLSHLSRGKLGTPYQRQVTTSGGKPPLVFEAEDLPAGLKIDRATGMISGTPTERDRRYVMLKVMDHNANRAEKRYRITITG